MEAVNKHLGQDNAYFDGKQTELLKLLETAQQQLQGQDAPKLTGAEKKRLFEFGLLSKSVWHVKEKEEKLPLVVLTVIKLLTRTRTDLAPLYSPQLLTVLLSVCEHHYPDKTSSSSLSSSSSASSSSTLIPRSTPLCIQALSIMLNCAIIDRHAFQATLERQLSFGERLFDLFVRPILVDAQQEEMLERLQIRALVARILLFSLSSPTSLHIIYQHDAPHRTIRLFLALASSLSCSSLSSLTPKAKTPIQLYGDSVLSVQLRTTMCELLKFAFNLSVEENQKPELEEENEKKKEEQLLLLQAFGQHICAILSQDVVIPHGATDGVVVGPDETESAGEYLQRREQHDAVWRESWRKREEKRVIREEKRKHKQREAFADDMVVIEQELKALGHDTDNMSFEEILKAAGKLEKDKQAKGEAIGKKEETKEEEEDEEVIEEEPMEMPCCTPSILGPLTPNSLLDLKLQIGNLLINMPALFCLLQPSALALQGLLDLLQIQLTTPPAGETEEEATCPILAMFTKLCETDQQCRRFVKRRIFGRYAFLEASERKPSDLQMKPAGVFSSKTNPDLRSLLIKLVTSMNAQVKSSVTEFLWMLCAEDSSDYIRLTGFGNAVGLLTTKGLPGFAGLMGKACNINQVRDAAWQQSQMEKAKAAEARGEDTTDNCFVVTLTIQITAFVIAYGLTIDTLTDFVGSTNFVVNALFSLYAGNTYFPRQLLLSAIVCVSRLDLAFTLLYRVMKRGKDSRFDEIREHFWSFFGFWIFQILWVWITMWPVMHANTNKKNFPLFSSDSSGGENAWFNLDVFALLFVIVGLVVQVVADLQKISFRANRANDERWCAVGVWRYSRHPNYFGEILLWWGVYLLAFPCLSVSPLSSQSNIWGLLCILSPLFTMWLLLFLSGIPTAEGEQQMVRWCKTPEQCKAFRAYREQTSPLIPLPPSLYSSLPSAFKQYFLFELARYAIDWRKAELYAKRQALYKEHGTPPGAELVAELSRKKKEERKMPNQYRHNDYKHED